MSLWFGPLGRLVLLVAAASAIGLAWAPAWGLGVLALGLGAAHGYHLLQLDRLRRWVGRAQAATDEMPPVPDAFGAWGRNFADLYRMCRIERVGRDRLAASLGRLSLAAEALPDGIVLLDEKLRIEWSNAAAARHLGIDASRDRGTPIAFLLRDPEFAGYLANGGAPVLIRPVSGAVRAMSLALIPFADSGRLLISRDMTTVERAETMRRDFVANVSHELRTPLTVIVGFLEGMVEPPANGSVAPQLALMYEQACRMQRLVDDLLTLFRLDAACQPASEEPVDVSVLLNSLVEEGRALSQGRHAIELDVAAAGLHGCREELRSAFANLISNAVRYTPDGGRIAVRWFLRDGQPVLSVRDTGLGIAPEHIPRLTERFYRVDRGRSSASGGTGLGLAIVKHVLLRHGGRLEIDSTPGRGSTFAAVFPADRVLLAQLPATDLGRAA